MKLKEQLNNFIEKGGLKGIKDDSNAHDEFLKIAQCILSGYFEVKSNTSDTIVKVIPTTVEFYYHEEAGGNKDYIVYHRNPTKSKCYKAKKDGDRPYFPMGVLHNHVSGIDITFESEKYRFRGSALIRAFRIENGQTNEVIGIYDEGKDVLTKVDKRSTYLYGALFSQFNIFDGFSIKWVDAKDSEGLSENQIGVKARQNVFDLDEKRVKMLGNNGLPIHDKREWSFFNKIYHKN